MLAKLANWYLERQQRHPGIANAEEYGRVVAIDWDGTLVRSLWTPDHHTTEWGDPIRWNVFKTQKLQADGWDIVIYTARPATDRKAILKACHEMGIFPMKVETGKLWYWLFIDDKNRNAAEENWSP